MARDREVNLTDFFKECGLGSQTVHILETEGMYPFNPDFKANWLYYTLKGYQFLKETKGFDESAVKKIACIAAGSGAEVIGLGRLFSNVSHICMTDIDPDVVMGCFRNSTMALLDMNINLHPVLGSLCEPLSGKFDLVNGNVPNLICDDKKDLSSGNEKGTFVRSNSLPEIMPKEYLKWGLGTQFEYLKGAVDCLTDNGSVVTIVGGRYPLEITEKLFLDSGLQLMPEFSVGFKWQTQPEPDFEGYAALEKEHGIEFDFFIYEDALKIMKKNGIENPASNLSGQELKDLFKGIRVSSTEALKLYKKGIICGHTVHMFRGKKLEVT